MRADVGRSAKPDPRKPLDLPMSKIDFSHLRHFIAQFDKAPAAEADSESVARDLLRSRHCNVKAGIYFSVAVFP